LLLASDIFKQSKNIACYVAVDHEFDLNPIIEEILNIGKLCYLPKINNSHLDFFYFSKNTPLELNRFNIPEPAGSNMIDKKDLDLVLLPLVGFDLSGHRLGMGGGFYDKSFSFLLDDKMKKPFLLGAAFECQKFPKIPTEAFDAKLDGALTEKTIYYF